VHPLGRPLPVTKSPRSLRPPPNVEHLAANGRATVACPPDGPARPRLRARRRQPQVAAHCIRSTRSGFFVFLPELSEQRGGSGSTWTTIRWHAPSAQRVLIAKAY